MLRGSRRQPAAPASTRDARERILAAAEHCIERHGIPRTTMDDIASEVGLSRPSIYRYFADRDDLLIELITRRARTLQARAHKAVLRQSNLSDQLIETLVYIADHGRHDPLTRHLIDPDGTSLGRRMITTGTSEILRAELYGPFLDAALANNELPPTRTARADIYLWIGNVTIMVARGLDAGDGDVRRYRSILRRFFASAFASANAQ